MAKELPEVDILAWLPATCRAFSNSSMPMTVAKRSASLVGLPQYLYDETTPRVTSSPFYSTYVKIAEGCNNLCSYCIIPQLRGPLRSRSIASVVAEVERLVAAGAQEINLIAQDITAFGADRHDGACLENLLRELVKVPDLRWLRLLYAYPDGISDELIELVATEEKICSYFDVPLQHIDDRVLARMNRRVGEDTIRDLVARMRQRIPDLTLRTSFIVGFPRRDRGRNSPSYWRLSKRVISTASESFAIPVKRERPPRPCLSRCSSGPKRAATISL